MLINTHIRPPKLTCTAVSDHESKYPRIVIEEINFMLGDSELMKPKLLIGFCRFMVASLTSAGSENVAKQLAKVFT